MSAQAQRATSIGQSIDGGVDLRETRARLEATLNTEWDDTESKGNTDDSSQGVFTTDTAHLLVRAAPGIAALFEVFRRKAWFETARLVLADLRKVIDEAVDLLEPIDLAALPDAVDFKQIPTVIEVEKLPKALTTKKFTEAIDFGRLTDLIDLKTMFQNVDLFDLQKNKKELDETVEEANDNLENQSEKTNKGDKSTFNWSDRLQQLYNLPRKTSDTTSTATTGGGNTTQSSQNPMLHSTVPSTGRPEMSGAIRLSTVPGR